MALTAGLAVRLLQLRLARHYRWMLIYLLASALQQLALFPFSPTSVPYTYGWVTSEIVLMTLRLLVASECFQLNDFSFPPARSSGHTNFYVVAAIGVGIILVGSRADRHSVAAGWQQRAFQCVFLARQMLLILASLFLTVTILATRWLGYRVAPNVRVHLNLSARVFPVTSSEANAWSPD